MQPAATPANEAERLAQVKKLGLLDTATEERFDAITRAAVQAFNVPISTITLMDDKREWYKSCQGLDDREAPREASFCAHAMLSPQIFVVEDTYQDQRFVDNPMVIGKPFIRFYAGVALYNQEGINVGVFCIKDIKPRKLSPAEMALLLDYAQRAAAELNTGKTGYAI